MYFFLCYLFLFIQTNFFGGSVFLIYNDVYFEHTKCYKKMTVKDFEDFIFDNY